MAEDAVVDRLKLELWNGSQYGDLTDLVRFASDSLKGLGAAKVNNLTQRGPSQDGVTWLGSRNQERVIQIALLGMGTDDPTMHARRADLVGLFKPNDALLQLRYSVPPNKQYQWDVYVAIGPDFDTNDQTGYYQRTVVELHAPDPTAYNPNAIPFSFGTSGGGTPWTLNSNWALTATGWTFGSSILNTTQIISMPAANAAETFPIITLTGPVTDPRILNTRTNVLLDFAGYSIGGGVTWTIDTRYASKSVVDASGVDQTYKLTESSGLSDFSFVPGDNPIGIYGTSVTSATTAGGTYYERYAGV